MILWKSASLQSTVEYFNFYTNILTVDEEYFENIWKLTHQKPNENGKANYTKSYLYLRDIFPDLNSMIL